MSIRMLSRILCQVAICHAVVFYRINGSLPRVRWVDLGANGVDQVVAGDAPLVITGVPASGLGATSTLGYLEEHLPRDMENVKRRPSAWPNFRFPSDLPMSKFPELLGRWVSSYSRHTVPKSCFFHRQLCPRDGSLYRGPPDNEEPGPESLSSPSLSSSSVSPSSVSQALSPSSVALPAACPPSSSGPVEAEPPSARSATHTLAFAANVNKLPVHVQQTFSPLLTTLTPRHTAARAFLWLSQAEAETPCHYDVFNNFYYMLFGQKRFVLLPPSSAPLLRLYPALHPAHRSVREELRLYDPEVQPAASSLCHEDRSKGDQEGDDLDHANRLADDLSSQGRDSGAGTHSVADALEVTLQPGEVLFLPAMWFHQVTSLGQSGAVNVWSSYEPTTLHDAASLVDIALANERNEDTGGQRFGEASPERIQLLRALVILVLVDVQARPSWYSPSHDSTETTDEAHAKAFIQEFVQQRYTNDPSPQSSSHSPSQSSLSPSSSASDADLYCFNNTILQAAVQRGWPAHVLQGSVSSASQKLKLAVELGGVHRGHTLIGNWVERVVDSGLGTADVQTFLEAVSTC